MIRVECPHCLTTLKLSNPDAIGKKAKCPKCKEPFTVEEKFDAEDFAPAKDEWDEFSSEDQAPAPSRTVVRKRREKRESRYEEDSGLNFLAPLGPLGWILAGGLGGAIGAGIWGGIAYMTDYEVGLIAWLTGVLVGVGVRYAANGQDGWAPGLTAAIIAIFSVIGGKVFAVSLLLHQFMGGAPVEIDLTDDDIRAAIVESIADEIVEEREAAGEKLQWPGDNIAEDAAADAEVKLEAADLDVSDDPGDWYPAGIWDEAEKRFNDLDEAERQKRVDDFRAEMKAGFDAANQLVGTGFVLFFATLFSFGFHDILWFFLATVSAFKIGASATDGE